MQKEAEMENCLNFHTLHGLPFFFISLNTKFPLHDRFLELINRVNREILMYSINKKNKEHYKQQSKQYTINSRVNNTL